MISKEFYKDCILSNSIHKTRAVLFEKIIFCSYLSLNLSSSREAGLHEDVELLLGSYSADLDEILTEIKIFIDMIEDTDQFISAHLDSVRNEIIKLSLFIEIGGLIMGVGAVVSGIFGMNLKNTLEDHPYAFILGTWIVCGRIH